MTSTQQKKDQLSDQYFDLFTEIENDKDTIFEWKVDGDLFHKFSLYDEYTPVEISNDTKLIVSL